MRRVLFIFTLIAAVALTSGCTDYLSPMEARPPEEVETTEVIMQNYRFLPQDIRVSVGDTVTWTNDDRVTHTVTADNGAFDSGEFGPGETFSYTYEQEGIFGYSCTIHPGMIGTVTVE